MFAEERRSEIESLIRDRSSVKVDELCEEFGVSSSTIRRDLQALEKEGIIKRTHGGAVIREGTKFEPSFGDKKSEHQAEKQAIGQRALDFIQEGETIIVDAGTTTTQLAKKLNEYNDLTIITNGMNIGTILAEGDNEVILVGGKLKKRTLAMVGSLTADNLKKLNVDKVFLGTNAIDLKEGLTTPGLTEANIKQTMVDRAEEVIVLADHSKFELTSFAQIVDFSLVDKIITDKQLDSSLRAKYEEKVRVITAD